MASVTCLFASGYKFNLAWPLQFDRLLVKTGTISISTSPKSAEVFLNNKQQTDPGFKLFKKDYVTTPIKLKNLIPARYVLRIEKEGYWPLEKEIRVESGLTTFAEDINLFRSNLPTLAYKAERSDILLSSSGNFIYLPETKEFINLKTMALELKVEEDSPQGGSWFKDTDEFFLSKSLYNLASKTVSPLGTEKVYTSTWKFDKDNGLIYTSEEDQILRLEKDKGTMMPLLQIENFLDFKEDGNSLFVISDIENNKYLLEYNLNTKLEVRRFELPALGNYKFFSTSSSDHLTLFDEQNSSLYLIDKDDWQDSYIISQVKDWQFIDKNRIIYHNGWEITMLNLSDGISVLLDRVSEPIEKILWHSEENYYIFTTNAGIHVGDLRTNILTSLFKTEHLGDIALDSENDILYFFADIGQQSGVYRLLLK